MTTIASAAFLRGWRVVSYVAVKPATEYESRNYRQAENKRASDEVTLTIRAQAEQKIEVAPVELGTAVVSQRAKGQSRCPTMQPGGSGFLPRAELKMSIQPW